MKMNLGEKFAAALSFTRYLVRKHVSSRVSLK